MSDSRIPWRTNRKLSDRVIDASISQKSCGAPKAKVTSSNPLGCPSVDETNNYVSAGTL